MQSQHQPVFQWQSDQIRPDQTISKQLLYCSCSHTHTQVWSNNFSFIYTSTTVTHFYIHNDAHTHTHTPHKSNRVVVYDVVCQQVTFSIPNSTIVNKCLCMIMSRDHWMKQWLVMHMGSLRHTGVTVTVTLTPSVNQPNPIRSDPIRSARLAECRWDSVRRCMDCWLSRVELRRDESRNVEESSRVETRRDECRRHADTLKWSEVKWSGVEWSGAE